MSGAREIARQLGHAVRVGHDWRCDCPIHGGRSLTVADGRDGKLLVKCWGGCEWRDIFPELRSRGLLVGGPIDISPERADELRRRRDAEARREIERLRPTCSLAERRSAELRRLRRQRYAQRIWPLGDRVLFELVDHIADRFGLEDEVDRLLDGFAGLSPDLLTAVGADHLPERPLHLVGDR